MLIFNKYWSSREALFDPKTNKIKYFMCKSYVSKTNDAMQRILLMMLISQDFTTQCLKSLLLRPFSKFKIIFF
ncbi:hypothetical protein EFR14_06955, partial [Lactobacillus delbrueckii]|nr:hypothetical protein [Lactobacillus delbrueckii]